MLRYFDNPFLRRGVVEWLLEMDQQLLEEDRKLFLEKIKHSFGSQAQECTTQGKDVASDVADVLGIWHFPDSKELVLGIAKYCTEFEGARNQAISALPKIATSLSKQERDSLVVDITSLKPTASDELKLSIANAITEIQNIQRTLK